MKISLTVIIHLLCYLADAQDIKPDNPVIQVWYSCVFNRSFERGQDYVSFQAFLDIQLSTSHFYMLPDKKKIDNAVNYADIIIEADTFLRVLKDIHAGRVVFGEPSYNGREKFFADTLHPMTWELINEMKYIDSLECYKAMAVFRGRNYTAWYCPAIPVPNGPWKLGGLPGLIIEAYEENNDLYFLANKVRSVTDRNPVPYAQLKVKQPSYPEYIQYWKDLIKKLDGALAAQQSTPGCVSCETRTKSKFYIWEKVL